MRENPIVDRSFEYARMVIQCCRILRQNREYDLASQLLRSGTSIGANVHEAQAALTKKEFISKMSIAAKEARETNYWIRLLSSEGLLEPYPLNVRLQEEIEALQRMLTSIIKTAQEKG